MKIKNFSKIIAAVLAVIMVATLFVGCRKDKYDNESTPFIMSVEELDGVFNPYFSTSGPDGEVVGMTQLSMFNTDPKGNAIWGGDQACMTLAYKENVVYGNDRNEVTDDSYTDYTYVLKPNVKFSDGKSVSIKDVLFGIYTVLDPVYTGNSTMYSTAIKGINQYRTQTYVEVSTGNKDAYYNGLADQRADRLADAVYNILTEHFQDGKHSPAEDISYTEDKASGERIWDYSKSPILPYFTDEKLASDYKFVISTFYEEIEGDATSAKNTIVEKNDQGVYPYKNITDTRQYFLWSEGLIQVDKEGDAKPDDTLLTRCLNMDWDQLIKLVFQEKMPGNYKKTLQEVTFYQIINYWATGTTVRTKWAAEEKSADLLGKEDDRIDHVYGITWNKQFGSEQIDNVSGEKVITPACYDATKGAVTIDGKDYPLAKYENSSDPLEVTSGFEVLNIRIRKVDPKAKWNFAISVTPMHYYSSVSSSWNGYNNFGVDFASVNFFDKVKSNLVPRGAGVYRATTPSGENDPTAKIAYKDFSVNNMVYYERNEYFYTVFCDADGKVVNAESKENNAKIKYVRYRVSNSQQVLDALSTKDIDYAAPNATKTNINTIEKNKDLAYVQVANLGYGYIGINAGKAGLESVYVRRAIATAFNTKLVLNYYTNGLATNIWYPMSSVSWAYPKDNGGSDYPYRYVQSTVKDDVIELLQTASDRDSACGYNYVTDAGERAFYYEGKKLKLTFTIAGSTDDHPAYNTLKGAADLLNQCGLDVEVKNDSNTLKKLASGGLQVWAAAWSSSIDPDMYQVYHRDSQASSVLNWGYREIKKACEATNDTTDAKYGDEWDMIVRLSEKIDAGRNTLDIEERKSVYKECLDIVLEMAVEIPTYQRQNLYAYNAKKLDASTMVPQAQCTAYQGPLSFIWKLSYNK